MTPLVDLTSPSVPNVPTVLVPVGSLEQHGPHLPLDTDTVIADAVARAAAVDLPGSLVAPPIAYGSSGEHQSFAGTVSIGTPTLTAVVVELVRSLRTWSGRVVLVNGHGGNLPALAAAVEQLRAEGHDVAWVPCGAEGMDLHAGRAETSLLLHLCPDRVRSDLAEPGSTAALAEILPTMRAGGVAAVSPNGVLGDPTGATADEGRALLHAMTQRVTASILAPTS